VLHIALERSRLVGRYREHSAPKLQLLLSSAHDLRVRQQVSIQTGGSGAARADDQEPRAALLLLLGLLPPLVRRLGSWQRLWL